MIDTILSYAGNAADVAINAAAYCRYWINGLTSGNPMFMAGTLAAGAAGYWLWDTLSGDSTSDVYGGARWAISSEIKKSKILHDGGSQVILGGVDGHFVGSKTHTLVFAPTGLGKGVGIVLPTLLTYSGGAVVNDPKGENLAKTARYRSQELGQRIVAFDPWHLAEDEKYNAHLNPLLYIDIDKESVVLDAYHLISSIIGKKTDAGQNAFFYNSAEGLSVFCVLYTCIAYRNEPDKMNLNTVRSLIMDPKVLVSEILPAAVSMTECGGEVAEIAKSLLGTLDKDDEPTTAFNSVVSNAQTYFRFLSDLSLKKFFSKNTVDLTTLDADPASIYIIIPPDSASEIQCQVFQRIVYSMIFKAQYRHKGEYKSQPILLCIDEMNALGYFELLLNSISIARGFNIRLLLIVQNSSQLEKNYGVSKHEFRANCSSVAYFGVSDRPTAEEISTLCGNRTVKQISKNAKGEKTESETSKPLMSVDEIVSAEETAVIVFAQGLRPIRAKRLTYYQDSRFKNRYDKFRGQ